MVAIKLLENKAEQRIAVETRERLKVCTTVKECVNSHPKYRFKTHSQHIHPA